MDLRKIMNRDLDPVAILPREVVLMLLRESLPPSSSYTYPPALIDLTSVCRRWEELILSTPIIWNTLHIRYSSQDLLFVLALFALQSKSAPLHIVLWNELGSEWDTVVPILRPHINRIHRMTLGNDPPIYGNTRYRDAEYASLAATVVGSLGYLPSLVELDFSRTLEIKLSQLKELDLPANTRITSPIQISLQASPFGNLFLTPLTVTEVSRSKLTDCLTLSNFIYDERIRSSDDRDVLSLNYGISSMIRISELLDCPSNGISTLMNSLCAHFIDASDGYVCLLCKDRQDSLVGTLGCLRSHFGLRPFKCPGCRLCNTANGFSTFFTSYLLRNHTGPTTCTTCGTQTSNHWVKAGEDALCDECIKLPNQVFKIARAAEVLGELKQALDIYEAVLNTNPRSWRALVSAGHTRRCLEEYPQAIEYFNRALQIDDKNGDIWESLGHCFLMQDELKSAYDAYQNALLHLPNPKEDATLWYGIGILYDRYGSFQHAEEAFSSVLKIDPNFEKGSEVYFRLGIIYKQLQQYFESLKCFDQILPNPPHPFVQRDIWFQIGHVYERQKDYVRARDAWDRVLAEVPNHAEVLQQLGWLYHQPAAPFFDQELAVQYLTRSLETDTSDAQSWYLLGRAYMTSQKYNKAYEAYQQAVYRDGSKSSFWTSIGILYFKINQFKDALDAYSRAIRLDPYVFEAWFNLGVLYESCYQQPKDAVDAYVRAKELDPTDNTVKERLELLNKHIQDPSISLGPAPSTQDVDPTIYPNSQTLHLDKPPPLRIPSAGPVTHRP